MRALAPVIVYETQPATEWLLGGPVQKVSPRYSHSAMQRALLMHLGPWAKGRGRLGAEWRFWLAPPGEVARYLVPDVAYLSYARLAKAERLAAEEPAMPPDAAFEVRSPSDREHLIDHKIEVYLKSGTALVVVIDPLGRSVRTYDRFGSHESDGAVFAHEALPGFRLDLPSLFSEFED